VDDMQCRILGQEVETGLPRSAAVEVAARPELQQRDRRGLGQAERVAGRFASQSFPRRNMQDRRDRDEMRIVPPGMTVVHGSANLRSEEHTSELQSRENLVCRLLLEKKKKKRNKKNCYHTLMTTQNTSDAGTGRVL